MVLNPFLNSNVEDKMNTQLVRVYTTELLNKLQKNMLKHVDEFNKAMAQFRIDVIEEMKENLDVAQNGGVLRLMLQKHNNPPRSYEHEYKKAIAKYEMSVDETVYLDDVQFQQFVLDIWQWSNSTSNSLYANKYNG